VSLFVASLFFSIAGCGKTELTEPEITDVERMDSEEWPEVTNKCRPGDIVFRFDTGYTPVESISGDDVTVRVHGTVGFDESGNFVTGRVRFHRENVDGENEGVVAILKADLIDGSHETSTNSADLVGFNINVRIDAAGEGEIRVPAGAIFPDITEAQMTISPAIVIRRTHG
jgi:hypothetical protein